MASRTAADPLLLDSAGALPRGRHALSREQVQASQRRRLLRAVTDEVGEHGYAVTTATRVFQRAGVSSRAFYEQFADVQQCFLAAYDECVRASHAVLTGVDATGAAIPVERFGTLLDAYLRLLAEHPNIARTFLVEIYSAGPAARERPLEVHEQFVRSREAVLTLGRRRSARDRAAVVALVDSIVFRVTRAVLADSLDAERGRLHRELLDVTVRLCPWTADPAAEGGRR
jgi:AcrR family transcriptional regulator